MKAVRRNFRRANKMLAERQGRQAYAQAIADGMPREQAKQFAKTAKRNSLR